MKTLVISDIHVGLATSKYKEFIEFFQKTIGEYDKVILLGDIIQGVFHKFTDDEMKFFDLLSTAKDVVYIIGNHDNDSSDGKEYSIDEVKIYIQSLFKKKITIEEEYYFHHKDKKYIFLHGHQFMSEDKSIGIKVAKGFYKLQMKFGSKYSSIFNIFDKIERVSSSAIKKVREGARDYLSVNEWKNLSNVNTYSYLFCGHSHQIDVYSHHIISKAMYFNDGQWLRNETNFIEIDDGVVNIYNYNIKTKHAKLVKRWS